MPILTFITSVKSHFKKNLPASNFEQQTQPSIARSIFPSYFMKRERQKKNLFSTRSPPSANECRWMGCAEQVIPIDVQPNELLIWLHLILGSQNVWERERSATTTLDEQELSIFFCGGTHTHTRRAYIVSCWLVKQSRVKKKKKRVEKVKNRSAAKTVENRKIAGLQRRSPLPRLFD